MKKNVFAKLFVGLLLLLLYAPILLLVFYSFTTSANIGTVTGFGLQNYATLIQNEELRGMLIGTLLLAFGSSVVATTLGTLGAIGAFYSKALE